MRRQELQQWCDQYFKHPVELHALSGDASFRRYFRIQLETGSWIVADAPPQTEKNAQFVDIAQRLKQSGVSAPEVVHFDLQRGFLLLSDLGDQVMLPLLNDQSVDVFYIQSLALISRMQHVDTAELDCYDRAALIEEMQLFPRWFVESLLSYELSTSEQQLLAELFELLVNNAVEQPQVFVHRDFHSRNLMIVEGQQQTPQIATIDFQDAVCGPITYDPVSLLRDCYIEWPEQRVTAWLLDFHTLCKQQNLIPVQQSFAEFKRWFDWMGLQRHIKVLGIFARLSIRDDKHGYLKDLPLVIKYIREVSKLYPEELVLREFLCWFEQQLMPLIQTKDWMQE